MRKPDFFIVGAPRCGTTAMQAYLQQHPLIYMPPEKETHHFATDLIGPDDRFRSRQTYLRLFEGAREDQIAGCQVLVSGCHLRSLSLVVVRTTGGGGSPRGATGIASRHAAWCTVMGQAYSSDWCGRR